MSGSFAFVITVSLIALGFLFGWSMSAWAVKDAWTAIGAIGSWFGGFGAIYAAHVALKIANKQAMEDTYNLDVSAIFNHELFICMELWEPKEDDFLDGRYDGECVLEVYNSGKRPIEVTKLIYTSKFGVGEYLLSDFLIPAGSRRMQKVQLCEHVNLGQDIKEINSSFLLTCKLQVEDAAKELHHVSIKSTEQKELRG